MTWRIKRIESYVDQTFGLDCVAPNTPQKVTLENTATGVEEVAILCADLTLADQCSGDGLLHLLSTPYPDNDFDCS